MLLETHLTHVRGRWSKVRNTLRYFLIDLAMLHYATSIEKQRKKRNNVGLLSLTAFTDS